MSSVCFIETENHSEKYMLIIGIDCAANHADTAMALGRWTGETATVEEVIQGSRHEDPVETVARWLEESGERDALLAMDAPLGWPAALAEELCSHKAGRPFDTLPNDLFRRYTDRFTKEHVGKQPLDVGADRIARAGHAALAFLGRLEKRAETRIALAWNPSFSGVRAIEVYPAATLKTHGISSRGYKAKDGVAERSEVLKELSRKLSVKASVPAIEKPNGAPFSKAWLKSSF